MLNRLLKPQEARAISFQTLFESGGQIPSTTRAGVNISQANSLTIAAVYASVRLISDTISTLPLGTFVRRDGARYPYTPQPAWVEQPEPDSSMQRSDHYQSLLVSLMIAGNSYTRIIRNGNGDVVALTVLDPSRITVRRNAMGQIEFLVDQAYVLQEQDVIHLTELRRPGALVGVSRVTEMRETFGLSKALEDFSAQFFGSGSTIGGVIEVPGDVTAEQAESMQSAWERGHKGLRKAFRPGILSGGAKFMKTSVEPNEAQMLESREFAVEEIARIFRIPPHMLQSTKPGAMSYASVEENSKQFVTYTLLPYIEKIEAAYSRLLPSDAFLKFNVDGLLRANLTERYAAYSSATQAGFLSINDIHRVEDMLPVEGGDVYRVPLANVNLAAANIVETEKRTQMLARLVTMGFDPAESLAAVGLPPIMHTGLPSVQLQQAATFDPTDPAAAYIGDNVRDVSDDVEQRDIAEDIADAIAGAISNIPAPVVNVNMPEQSARSKRVERDAEGNITAIVEE
jgi:HK97 family phage portal protein